MAQSLLDRFLELYDDFVATPFPLSGEGETGEGVHEKAVAAYFHSKGFGNLEKTITEIQPATKRKAAKEVKRFVMNRETHAPTAGLTVTPEAGFFTILQPYTSGRGSFNPAPDLYLVEVANHRVVNWLGIECKSSKGAMRPTWNDNLPRVYSKGNIIYLVSGEQGPSKSKVKKNTIFTAEAFYGKTSDEVEAVPALIKGFYERAQKSLEEDVNTHDINLGRRFTFKMRQKVELRREFTAEEVTEYTAITKEVLKAHSKKISKDGDGAVVPAEVLEQAARNGEEVSNSSNNEAPPIAKSVSRKPGQKARRVVSVKARKRNSSGSNASRESAAPAIKPVANRRPRTATQRRAKPASPPKPMAIVASPPRQAEARPKREVRAKEVSYKEASSSNSSNENVVVGED